MSQEVNAAKVPSPIALVFAHLDAIALGVATGSVSAIWLFVATVVLLLKGGAIIGPRLGLLGQYFPGYDMTWGGAFLGAVYAFLVGFSFGFLFAFLRNVMIRIYLILLARKARQQALGDLP